MELIVLTWIDQLYSDIVQEIRGVQNHFLRGFWFIVFHAIILGLAYLAVESFLWNWEVPVGVIAFWLICEGVRALGKAIQ